MNEKAMPATQAPAAVDQMRAHVESFASSLGWKAESGEGAFEFVQRASYRQGWQDGRREALGDAHRDLPEVLKDLDHICAHGDPGSQETAHDARDKLRALSAPMPAPQAPAAVGLTVDSLYEILRATGYMTRDQCDECADLILAALSAPMPAGAAVGEAHTERDALVRSEGATEVRRRLWDVVREVRPDLFEVEALTTLDALLRQALPGFTPPARPSVDAWAEIQEGGA